MKNSSTNTESNPTTATNEDNNGIPVVTPADLGYDEPTSEDPAPKEEPATSPKEDPAPKEDEKVSNPATGYGKPANEDPAPKEESTPKEEKKPEEMTEEEKAEKAIADSISTLGDSYDKEKIKKFAKDHKLSKEQVDAYVAQVKADQAEAQKNNDLRVKETRKAWNEELMADKEFGGENFDKSVHEAEKTLEKYFPNTKKVLTDKKGMLPPYLMKDLLNVAKVLKPGTKLELGEAPAPAEEPTSFLDEMYT